MRADWNADAIELRRDITSPWQRIDIHVERVSRRRMQTCLSRYDARHNSMG
jgi:hypothetical protein